MAARAESCVHCGKQGAELKRCSRCKQASYCGAACQNLDWTRHKKTCAPPLPMQDVAAKIQAALAAGDWRRVLQWEGRMEELVARQSDDVCSDILSAFSRAHRMGYLATKDYARCEDHVRSYVGLVERRIPLLGKLQRFRHQGEAMCRLANILIFLGRNSEAATWHQRARDVGASHGFFSLESAACRGLGRAAIAAGRHEEGQALLRNALVAAELSELDDPAFELDALDSLISALFESKSIDEVEPLVPRYREAVKAQSERGGMLFCSELGSIVFSARLHEVLCLCTPRLGTPFTLFGACFQHDRIACVCHRFCHGRGRHMHLSVGNRRHVHVLNLPSSAGTRGAWRGGEGGARSARPDARERGSSAERCRGMCAGAVALDRAPHHSPSGGWGGGAYAGGGSRTGQTAAARKE